MTKESIQEWIAGKTEVEVKLLLQQAIISTAVQVDCTSLAEVIGIFKDDQRSGEEYLEKLQGGDAESDSEND